jgi:hypothetical protein
MPAGMMLSILPWLRHGLQKKINEATEGIAIIRRNVFCPWHNRKMTKMSAHNHGS